jgi:hypothetical protein
MREARISRLAQVSSVLPDRWARVGPMTARVAISVGDLDLLPANAVERFGGRNAAGLRSLTMLLDEGIRCRCVALGAANPTGT